MYPVSVRDDAWVLNIETYRLKWNEQLGKVIDLGLHSCCPLHRKLQDVSRLLHDGLGQVPDGGLSVLADLLGVCSGPAIAEAFGELPFQQGDIRLGAGSTEKRYALPYHRL